MWLSLFVGFLVATIILMASFILARSSRSVVNKSFAIFSILTGVWIAANYIGANFKEYAFSAYFIHVDLFTGALLVLFLWLFTYYLARNVGISGSYIYLVRTLRVPLIVLTVVAALSTFFPSVVHTEKTPEVTMSYGSLFTLYSLCLLLLISGAIANLAQALRHAHGTQRQQISMMAAGLAVAAVFIAIPNLLVPLITDSPEVNLMAGNLAYVGPLLFIIGTFYSIVWHKLFDLKLILARTIAYTLSISTFTAFYVGATALISALLIKDYYTSPEELAVTIGIILLLTLTINPVRRFFDRSTDKLFYQDAYDPQTFLNQLNKTIIDNIEIGILLRRSAKVIESNLKSEHVIFTLYGNDNSETRYIDHTGHIKEISHMSDIRGHMERLQRSMVVADDLPDDSPFKRLLQNNGVAIICSLKSASDQTSSTYALLSIGPKKSGNNYGGSDVRIIEIITNELTIAIQNALRFEEIQDFNITLQQKIRDATEEMRLVNSRLAKANVKLQALDEAKDDFISMASHQLRTPLTSVKGYLSMVMEGDAGKITPKQRNMLNQALVSSQRMVYIISDLLNVSRLRTGKFVIEPAPVNLAQVIEEEIGQLKEMAEIRDVQVRYKPPKKFPDLMIDETKTRQIIMNLIDNAIYYTPSGGKIDVCLENKDSTVEFRVKDTGIGVPRAEQKHLFTKFYRAGNARKARPDGTGLGLFMAKKVVIAQGGAIIFESKEGQGSTFGFLFSKAKLPALPTRKSTTK